MEQHPSISVIIPTFNRAETIVRAVRSALLQNLPPLEVIVVDDGSTDDTLETLAQITDPCLKIISGSDNKGAQAARNRGIEEARGDYLVFLDSDDELLEASFENRIKIFEREGDKHALVYGDIHYQGETPQDWCYKVLSGRHFPYLLKELSLCPYSAMMISRACFDLCELPDATLPSWQDDAMVLTIAKHFPVYHCGSFVARMYRSQDAISMNKRKVYEGCCQLVSAYQEDIKEYVGSFRLFLWRARVLRSRVLISVHESYTCLRQGRLFSGLCMFLLTRSILAIFNVFLRPFFQRLNS